MKKYLPKIGSIIRLKKSISPAKESGKVIALDILNQKLKVLLEKKEIIIVEVDDIDKVLKEGVVEEISKKEDAVGESDVISKN